MNTHRLLIGREEKMGPGPIFCCYVLKLRMFSFLQNGAWPHFFASFFLIPFFAKFVPQSYNRAEKSKGGSHEAAFRIFNLAADISYILGLHITTEARRGFSSSEPGAYF